MTEHIFAGNPLDRCEAERRDENWIAAQVHAPSTRFLPFHRLQVLTGSTSGKSGLTWLDGPAGARLIGNQPPVLLGKMDGRVHFGLDISHLEDPLAAIGITTSQFTDCRMAAMNLNLGSTGIIAQARAQVNWHTTHRFCGACGTQSEPRRGGHVRVCPNCKAEHFPRTDPVAIMLVTDGDRCLLGQPKGPLVRTGIYSALAGFIDQGESIEEAVRREVKEEAGLEVGAVRYHSSQPWPFVSSLMIGCLAVAATTDIHMDTEEMHDVRWFSRQEILNARAGTHPKLKLPGPIAIAHHLIEAWVAGF
ncbi:MAG: NAD(+) diphosphatase [Gammaproteobacteria bacterium]|nr:NAD(+) diphosphatase [Gammaproteobacteria bacterium]